MFNLRKIAVVSAATAALLGVPTMVGSAAAQPCVLQHGINVCLFTEPGYLGAGVIVNNTNPVSGYAEAYLVCAGQTYVVAFTSATGVIVNEPTGLPCVH
ncbi:MAG: hypothetical protein QOE05_288 [Actinomycetota bacterium]|nr:hypothetical protein [Actinomycetota bacterium]